MTLEVYLLSFGPQGADTETLLIALGAEQDGFGAWQVDLGDGAAAEVSGLGGGHGQKSGARAGLVRLTGLTKRGGDLLYAIARGGGFALILPDPEVSGGVRVFLPSGFDPALVPLTPPYDAAQSVENPSAFFAHLSEHVDGARPEKQGSADAAPPILAADGWLQRLLGRLRDR